MDRRALILGLGAAGLATPAFSAAPSLDLHGRYQQGGFAFGLTTPRARLTVDGEDAGLASAAGYFVVGFHRDSPPTCQITVANDEGSASRTVTVAPTDYDIQRVDGLPQNTVTPTEPALLERIAAEVVRKNVGFASHADSDDFKSGFVMPVAAVRVSGRFGGQRVLNGVPATPHFGTDLACPTGTQIVAPAAGLVCFAEPDMHYEGGLTMIDHGQGLISLYLHQSRVDVAAGQRVAQGQPVGLAGMTGRATRPHLGALPRWRPRLFHGPEDRRARAPGVA